MTTELLAAGCQVDATGILQSAMPEQSPPAMPCPVDQLPASLVTELFAALGLPVDALGEHDIAHEIAALAEEGLLPHALLACTVVWAARRTDCGPARAIGIWSQSNVVGLVVEAKDFDLPTRASHDAVQAFTRAVQHHEAGIPELLLPTAPDADLQALVRSSLAASSVDVHASQPGTYTLSAVPGSRSSSLPELSNTPGGIGEPPRIRRGGALNVRVSALWRCLSTARSILYDVGPDNPAAAPAGDRASAVQELIRSSWIQLLPELAPRMRDTLAHTHSVSDILPGWLSLVGDATSVQSRYALAQRAEMIENLAEVTVRCPIAGYGGLLANAAGSRRDQVIAAARAAGISVAESTAMPTGGAVHVTLLEGSYSLEIAPAADTRHDTTTNGCAGPEGGAHGTGQCTACLELYREHAVHSMASARSMAGHDPEVRINYDPAEGVDLLTIVPMAEAMERDAAIAPVQGPTATFVGREPWSFRIDNRLLDARSSAVVEIRLYLSGDRNVDLERITRLNKLLDRHPGPVAARVILLRASFKRIAERGLDRGVTLNDDLRAELIDLLGPDCLSNGPGIS